MAVSKPTKGGGGRWVTMHGAHVYIEGGKITAGPPAVVGMSVETAKYSKSAFGTADGRGHEPAPSAPRPGYGYTPKTPASTKAEAQRERAAEVEGRRARRSTPPGITGNPYANPYSSGTRESLAWARGYATNSTGVSTPTNQGSRRAMSEPQKTQRALAKLPAWERRQRIQEMGPPRRR